MERKKRDVSKIKQILAIKSIVGKVIVIGGGIALVALGHYLWGLLLIAFGGIGFLAKLTKRKSTNWGEITSGIKDVLGLGIIIGGGLALIISDRVIWGIVCLCLCVVEIIEDALLMPWIEKKYFRTN